MPSKSDLHRLSGPVRLWLMGVAVLVFAIVLIGGATRLTESGLSIVEWRPITGTLPPLSEQAWETEFSKYRTIPQYQSVNRGMSLAEFKTIYWWEWTHRLMGRVIGVAFLLPFLFFLWRGWISRPLQKRLWLIFGLGALQGAFGWWMVASGLSERVTVSPYRLAWHLTLASMIFALIVWTLHRPNAAETQSPARVRIGAGLLLGLVLIQIYLGGLVAGLRAGSLYDTWPLIDGAWVPDFGRLFFETPLWRNFFENPLTAQFDHRMVAYALWIVAVLHAVDVHFSASDRRTRASAAALAGAVTLQAALGILTVLNATPIGLALPHQAMAMVVLALATVHAAHVVPSRSPNGSLIRPDSLTAVRARAGAPVAR